MNNILITVFGAIGFPSITLSVTCYDITATYHTSREYILSNCPNEFLPQLTLVQYDDLLDSSSSTDLCLRLMVSRY